jgi:hypothetical protein
VCCDDPAVQLSDVWWKLLLSSPVLAGKDSPFRATRHGNWTIVLERDVGRADTAVWAESWEDQCGAAEEVGLGLRKTN